MSQRAYIGCLAVLGGALLVVTLPGLPMDKLAPIVLLAVLAAVAQRLPVALFTSSSVSVSVAFAFSGMLLFGPAAAILINLPSAIVHAFYPRRRPARKIIFNLALAAIAAGLTGLIYLGVGGQKPINDYLASVLPVAIAAFSYFLIQSLAVTGAILMTEGGNFRSIWQSNYRWLAVHYLGIGGISMGMALAYQVVGPLGLLSFILPVIMAWYSLQLYMERSKEVRAQNNLLQLTNSQLEDTFLSTIRALAAAADTKDHYTHDHSEVAMRYAGETARQMGLDPTTVAVVQVGALFHDIGKIGVPESMLQKPAPLNDAEWEMMRQHPLLGAKVIEQVAALKAVVPVVMHHHERYDGSGYPAGLRGDEIPLAAQIVAVVDAYQAMSSDRPYRRALSHEYAVAELRRHASKQFSAPVVEAFIAAREAALAGRQSSPQVDLSLLLRSHQLATPLDYA